MAEKNFAVTPSVSISRSKFLRTSTHKTSFNLGEIVPVYLDEVLPGDTRSIDLGALVRMSTPIAPIMDDIELELFAFFVPNRIVWKNWKKFMGEAAAAGFDKVAPVAPYVDIGAGDLDAGYLGDYFGIPNVDIRVSALPLRGYVSIYNRWFRDQNVEAPKFIDDGDGEDSTTYQYSDSCLKAYKKSDYFTRALPYAQKGEPVSLPLGTLAPLKAVGKTEDDLYDFADSLNNPAMFGDLNGAAIPGEVNLTLDDSVFKRGSASPAPLAAGVIASTNIYADLSKATAATINQLREAFQLQKLLEKDALYGTRYWEILYGHFGVRSPDASLQDPEYLGGFRMNINVDQVLQTSASSGTQYLGTPGANSVTGGKGSLFTKSFVEHGFIHILAVARQKKHTYGQGLNRMWTRFDRYSYYWPEFANLGAQEIKNKELFAQGDVDDEKVFGYQEAWAEYRYKPSQVSGLLNPKWSGSFDYWTLSDFYTELPTLSKSFLQESRDNIMRALVSGDEGPDFIADFYFQDTAVRPMPMYSIPGLIDHH